MVLQRVKLNSPGVKKLLQSPEVRADLERRGRAIAQSAGDGMEVESDVGPTRARASVHTATPDAMRREAIDRALTRAIDAGRR